MRAAPLEWLGLKLPLAIGAVPLNKAGHSWFQYRDAETVPSEAVAAGDSAKAEIRQTHIDEGKVTPEEIERGFTATPKPWFKALVADIDATLVKLQNLDEISRERFGDAAPNYGKLRSSIDEVHRTARQLLKKKLELEPDPVDSVAAEGGVSVPDGVMLPGSVAAQLSVIPTSKEDAAARITVSAKFLRQAEPTNPASYLLLRGFRWGELRASGRSPDPRLLEAPTTATRTQLKSLLLDSRWEALLDACEGVMATPQGRGWLDLQRYALTACQQLGTEYEIVATAIRGALRSLLTDLPSLIDMTMMDDTAVANAETRKWLSGLLERDVDAETADAGQNGAASPLPLGSRNGRSAALAEVRAGRTDRAIALLLREAEMEKSSRGRFLVQTELASIMVTAGHLAIAQPILEELLRHIDTHKLEEWESGDVVARPMALLYRVLENSGDAGVRQGLYLRICRLDPLQAIGFAQG
jgi:type VI secretion system protein ImpA